ncbi:MAG: hypothetical protein K1X56_10880 [Flavobacteriales bacterium]|nr:hypothetical protein [Flavobacteriales bacterium]
MNKEIQCPNCKAWMKGSGEHCDQCGAVLNRHEYIREERIKQGLIPSPKPKKKSRIEIWLDKTEDSENTLIIVLRTMVAAFWLTWMAILGFFIWLITLLAG